MKKHWWKLCATTLCLLMVSSWMSQASAEEPLEDLQLKAYLSLVKGDGARDRQQYEVASSHYRRAYKYYTRVKEADPKFRPDIVAYRLRYCATQINELSQTQSLSAAEQAKAEALMEENTYLRKRIGQMEEEIEQARIETPPTPTPPSIEAPIVKDAAAHEEIDTLKTQVSVLEKAREQASARQQELAAEAARQKQANMRLLQRAEKLEQALNNASQGAPGNNALEIQVKNQEDLLKSLKAERNELKRQLEKAMNTPKPIDAPVQRQESTALKSALERIREMDFTITRLQDALNERENTDPSATEENSETKALKAQIHSLQVELQEARKNAPKKSGGLFRKNPDEILEAKNAELAEIKAAMNDRQRELKSLSKQLEELSETNATLLKKAEHAERMQGERDEAHRRLKKLSGYENTVGKLENKIEELHLENRAYNERITALNREVKDMQVAQKGVRKLEDKNAELIKDQEGLTEEIKALKLALKDQRKEIAEARKKAEAKAGKAEKDGNSKLAKRNRELEQELDEMREQITEAKQKASEANKLAEELQELKADYAQLQLQLDAKADAPEPTMKVLPLDEQARIAYEAEIAELKKSKEKSQVAIRQVLSKLEEYKGYVERLKKTNEAKIQALVKKIDDLNRKNEVLSNPAE